MILAFFISLLAFTVHAGPFTSYRVYEYERVRVIKSTKASPQDHLTPKPEDIGFRSYATQLRPQRPRPIKSKRQELGFGRR